MRRADLSLSVSQRKLPCVLDPTLALGHGQGPELASRLVRVMEPWLTRSFWQLIDASDLISRDPPGQETGVRAQPDADALATWIGWRDRTDAGSWTFRWIGDNFAESQLQDAAEADVVDRYENLSEALSRRCASDWTDCSGWVGGFDPLVVALDALTLSATLNGALLLSLPAPRGATEPWPVQALRRLQIETTHLDPMPEQSLFAAERTWVRQALATAGVVTLLQSLPPLAVVHVAIDSASGGDRKQSGIDPWAAARAWWYSV